jgi:HlyD family secretion protein
VWVLVDGQPARRAVTTGITDGSFTEITGGELREGEPVIAGLAGSGAAGNRGGQRGGFRIL